MKKVHTLQHYLGTSARNQDPLGYVLHGPKPWHSTGSSFNLQAAARFRKAREHESSAAKAMKSRRGTLWCLSMSYSSEGTPLPAKLRAVSSCSYLLCQKQKTSPTKGKKKLGERDLGTHGMGGQSSLLSSLSTSVPGRGTWR